MSESESGAPHPRVAHALAEAGVAFALRRHADCPFPVRSPQDFARCLGRPVTCITKSLFLETRANGGTRSFAVAVCPAPLRADFSVLARHWNTSDVRMASREDLATQLNFPPTGVSPLGCGMPHVVIDEAVFAHATVLVGAGVAGLEVELAPEDLRRACGATRLAFAHN